MAVSGTKCNQPTPRYDVYNGGVLILDVAVTHLNLVCDTTSQCQHGFPVCAVNGP